MPYGYNGKILRIDLGTKKIHVEKPDEIFYRMYMGGSNSKNGRMFFILMGKRL